MDSAPIRNRVCLSLDPCHNRSSPTTQISIFPAPWLERTVQHLQPALQSVFKAHCEQDVIPILVSTTRTSTTVELGSMAAPPLQVRRSSRRGRGSNGRDVQLDMLGDVLSVPTRKAKKRFAPSNGLSLPDNLLAPVPKRRRKNKKVFKIP